MALAVDLRYGAWSRGWRGLSGLSEQAERDERGWISRLAHTEADRRELLARGWADSPAFIKSAQTQCDEAIAQAAAERAYSDRRMSDAAKAEFHAADVANGDEKEEGTQ